MAHTFAVQAQLQVKGPPNLRPLISQIKAGLSGINANINLRLSPTAVTNIGNLNTRLTTLNKNLTAIQSSGKKANVVLQELATTFNSMGASAATVSASLGKINASVARTGTTAKSAGKSVSEFGELVGQSAKKFVAFSIAAGAVAGLVFSIQNGFRDAIKFQHELVRLAQVGGDSASVIKGITQEVTKLSTTLGVSSQGLIETAVTLRQAGLTATETKKALEALAKTELAPTFDDIKKTTEGAIAIMAQFKIRSKDLEGALGSINTVSAKYAVESGDLIEAVRRSGGAFKAAGGSLEEFLALFTSVRATTRESAESIATGFRTIFARLQQPGTINSLKQIGVTLDDMKGQFVGPYEAVKRLSSALQDIPTSDKRFAQVVETIGGIRQVSKVIPLLKEFTMSQQAYNDALAGQTSLSKDAITAQASLTVRITKLKEEFLDLFRVISENSMIQAFIGSALSLASALIKITRALEPLLPLLTVFAAVKLGRGVAGFAAGIGGGLTKSVKMARGGTVPGSGNGDTVPAMLTPGEFVIKKSAAQAIGHDTLKTWNKYASGGPITLPKSETVGQIALRAEKGAKKGEVGSISVNSSKKSGDKARAVLSRYQKTHPEITPFFDDILTTARLSGPVDTYVLDKHMSDEVFEQQMAPKVFGAINGEINKYKPGKRGFSYDVTKDQNFADTIKGFLFEAFLSVKTGSSAAGGTSAFDFDVYGQRVGKFADILKDQPFRQGWYDAKASRQAPSALIKKAADQSLFNNKITANSLLSQLSSPVKSSPARQKEKIAASKSKPSNAPITPNTTGMKFNTGNAMASIFSPNRYATGGPISGSDTVPAMLTPGEFVINKDSARAIGHNNLNKVNKFAKGGPVGFASGGTVGSAPAAPIDMNGLIVQNLKDFFKNARSRGATNVDISKYTKEIMESLVEQVKRASPHLDDTTARSRASGLFQPDAEIMMNRKGKFMGSKQKEEAIASRFNAFLASPGPGAPFPLNKPAGRFDRIKGFGGKFGGSGGGKIGTAATVAGFAIPGVAEQFLGNASQPGIGGRTGAGIGSVIGGAAAGATTGALIGSVIPGFGTALGAVTGGVIGATTSLLDFQKELKDIDSQKISDEFIKALDKAGTKAGNSDLASNTKAISTDIAATQNSGLGPMESLKFGAKALLGIVTSFGDVKGSLIKAGQAPGTTRSQEVLDKFSPALEGVLAKFKELADKNPGKDLTALKADPKNKALTDSLKALTQINPKLVKETEAQITNLQKQNIAQQNLDLSLLKLSISADELATKLTVSADIAEKNFARNAIGRGGKLSTGVDNFNIGSLGAQGKELNDFAKTGGVLDRAKIAITESLKGMKGGQLDKDSVQNQIISGLGKVQGFDAKSDTGKLLLESITNAIGGDEGDKLIQGVFRGDVGGLVNKALEGPMKSKADIDKADQELSRALQMFSQNAISIAEQQDAYMGEQERIDQFRLGAEKDRATALMRNNDVSFRGRRGNIITPEDQMNEINARAANESFIASQKRFGVNAADSANPGAIAARIRGEQGNLAGLVKQGLSLKANNAPPEEFKKLSDKILESTSSISKFQQALKNAATNTLNLEAAQAKLNTALEKEAGDLAGRKKVGEERGFGSRADIIKGMMADRVISAGVQQGNFEGFSDEQRSMAFSRLQETSDVVRNNGMTGKQIIDFVANQFSPQSNIAKTAVQTPNGIRGVSNDVLREQANVSAIQGRMGEAGDALQGIIHPEITAQSNENLKEFNGLLKNVNGTLGDLLNKKAPGFANGGMAKGTDTVPAMLSPGEFVVNAKSTSKNKGLLNQINSGKVQYAAAGGIVGISSTRDKLNKMLEDRKAEIEVMKAQTEIRKRENEANEENNRKKYPNLYGPTGERKIMSDKLVGPPVLPFTGKPEGWSPFGNDEENQRALKSRAQAERAKEISKRVARRERLGLPQYTPMGRPDSSPANAFNDPQAAQMRGEQIARENNTQRRNVAAQNLANAGNSRGQRSPFAMNQQGGNNGMADAAKQFMDNSKPLVDALNSFPKELVVKRDGVVQVVLNGAEVMAKVKGDLEQELWAKIIETIQREVPKAVKKMPG